MKKEIRQELKEHIPFTIFATVSAIVVSLILSFFINYDNSKHIFEGLHIVHVIFSAFASTLVFKRHNNSVMHALLVGVAASIFIGTISDVILPFLGALILGLKPQFHMPILENPLIILSSALVGTIASLKFKNTKLPHLLHVFVSVFASLFYLVSFTNLSKLILWILSVIIVFISVLIPCCLSDIIFPLLLAKKSKKHYHL